MKPFPLFVRLFLGVYGVAYAHEMPGLLWIAMLAGGAMFLSIFTLEVCELIRGRS